MAFKYFQDMRFFVFCLSILILTEVIGSVYYRSALTTIERRFELSATKIALLSTSYQVGNLAVMAFVSFYGSKTHRPRFIAIGALFACAGYITCSLPQFFGGRYQYVDSITNNSASASKLQMCDASGTATSLPTTEECEESKKDRENNLYIVVIVGLILCGIGVAPLQPLGMSYIDDYSHPTKSPVYVGITMTLGLIGPTFGFLLGAAVLRIWVDVGWIDTAEINILPTHPGWVGAWWIGFLMTGILVGVSSIPLYFFPKKLVKPESKGNVLEVNSKIDANNDTTPVKVFSEKNTGIFQASKSLFTNATFLVVIVMWIFSAYSVVGEITFFPKFLEVQFGLSASKANMYYGATSISCLAVGTMLGSYLMRRLHLDRFGMIKLILGSRLSYTLIAVVFLFLGCETIDIAGITKPYADSTDPNILSTLSSCNSGCDCANGTFSPVCGADGLTYISPCHAGCQEVNSDLEGMEQNYTDCNCIGSHTAGDQLRWSYPERCRRSKCGQLVNWVLAAKGLSNFLGGVAATPGYVYLMRSVGKKEKAFAIGIVVIILRLLAWIPGPIIYGKAIDSTCIYWASRPCFDKGYCRVYDTDSFRTVFFSIILAGEALSCVFTAVLCLMTKRQKLSSSNNFEDIATEGRESHIVLHQPSNATKGSEIDSTESTDSGSPDTNDTLPHAEGLL